MEQSSIGTFSLSAGGARMALPPYIAIVVLITGVIGGLLLVIAVIIFCKYCLRRDYEQINKSIHEDLPDLSLRKFRNYEGLPSKIESDRKSSITDGSCVGDNIPIRQNRLSCENIFDQNEIDYAVAKYRESLKDEMKSDKDESSDPRTTMMSAQTTVPDSFGRRRVSFLLSENKRQQSAPELKSNRQLGLGFLEPGDSAINISTQAQKATFRATVSLDSYTPNLSDILQKSTDELTDTISVLSPVNEEPNSNQYSMREVYTNRNASTADRTNTNKAQRGIKGQAFSLEVVSRIGQWAERSRRRSRSCEGDYRDHYDRLEITQFQRERACSADPETGSCGGESPRRCVRYNDAGSFEEVDDDQVRAMPLASIRTPNTELTVPCTIVPRQLWSLRSTFEEEEGFSDKARMEDMLSPEEQSAEEHDHLTTSMTTSFESNAEPHARGTEVVPYSSINTLRIESNDESVDQIPNNLPNNVLLSLSLNDNKVALRRAPLTNARRTDDTSFESIEPTETDLSDASRCEATTSFESTTDSTGDSQAHRLQHMRDDSGYKSLETQQSNNQMTLDQCEPVGYSYAPGKPISVEVGRKQQRSFRGTNVIAFDRRNAKSASKKRREYGKERQIVRVYDCEPESDSRSDQPSGDSFDDRVSLATNRDGILPPFIKARSADYRRDTMVRDYSVDEKTNAVFNEFMRYDPAFEQRQSTKQPLRHQSRLSSHSILQHGRHRLGRKPNEPFFDMCRKMKVRSASLGSDSSGTSRQCQLYPHVSIEEELAPGDTSETVNDRNMAVNDSSVWTSARTSDIKKDSWLDKKIGVRK